jgi:hypothetical protein
MPVFKTGCSLKTLIKPYLRMGIYFNSYWQLFYVISKPLKEKDTTNQNKIIFPTVNYF